jgi:hypothetical protein
MLRTIVLDSDKSHSSLTDAGGKPTTRLLKRNSRGRLPNKRVTSKRPFNKKKVKTMKRKKEIKKQLPN